MKVQALNLGKYDTTCTFRLYRFPMPISPPLNSPISTSPTTSTEAKSDQRVMYYYCLEDLERLDILAPVSSFRHVNTLILYREYPTAFCKNVIDGYTYVNTQVLDELASCFKSKLLMGLCQLTEHTPSTERYLLLHQIPLLDTTSIMVSPDLPPSLSLFSKSYPVQLVEQVLHPVRLDGQEWFLQPWIQHGQYQRLSPPQDEHFRHHPPVSLVPNVSVTDMDSRTKESSLLLQRRLAPKLGHHAPHLTINTPTYKDSYLHSIQSAPLRKSISKQQNNKRLQAAAAAATMTGAGSNNTLPPSPAAAVPWLHQHHESPRVTQQKNVEPTNGVTHGRPSSSSWMATAIEKHSFLRTLEQLHDTLEHTRTQKSTLDDTIRQTSVTLGKLQHSSLPQRINQQVTKQMDEWMLPYLEQLEQCMTRLLMLETRLATTKQQHISPAPPETRATQTLIDKTPMKAEILSLMKRLDQLERKTTPTMLLDNDKIDLNNL